MKSEILTVLKGMHYSKLLFIVTIGIFMVTSHDASAKGGRCPEATPFCYVSNHSSETYCFATDAMAAGRSVTFNKDCSNKKVKAN